MAQFKKSRLLIVIAGGLLIFTIAGYYLNWHKTIKRIVITKLGILALREEAAGLQAQAAALQAQTTALQTQTTGLQAQTTALQAQTTALQAQSAEALGESAALKSQNTALAEELKTLKNSTSSLQAYLNSEQFYGRAPAPQNKLCRFLALETSVAPDPAKSTYPNCLRTIRARVLHAPPGANIPGGVVLTTWAFRENRPSPEMKIQPGDQFSGLPLLPERLGLDIQEIQRADTIESRISDSFYYVAQAAILPSKKSIHLLPQPPFQRQTLMNEAGPRIKAELERHGGDWQSWMNSLAPLQRKFQDDKLTSILPDYPGQMNLFASGVSSPLKLVRKGLGGKELSNVEQIRLIADEFERRGINFIYVPIPLKAIAWPELFISKEDIPADGLVAPQWRKFVLDLVSAGVEVVDLQPIFRKYISEGGKRPLYFYEHHWAPAGIELAARETARHLLRFVERSATLSIVRTEGKMEYMLGDRRMSLDGYSVWRETPQGLDVYADNPDSPIVLCGDSNLHHVCRGAPSNEGTPGGSIAGGDGSFAAQLAFELQMPLARGSRWGAFYMDTSFRQIPPEFFASKKAVVFIEMMTSSEMYASWGADSIPAAAFGK